MPAGGNGVPDHDIRWLRRNAAESAAQQPGTRRARVPLSACFLTGCAILAGIHASSISDGSGLPGREFPPPAGQVTAAATHATAQHLTLPQPTTSTTVQLDAGDRLIIASLDTSARRHDVRVVSHRRSNSGSILCQRLPDEAPDEVVRVHRHGRSCPRKADQRPSCQMSAGHPVALHDPRSASVSQSTCTPSERRTFRLPWFPESSRVGRRRQAFLRSVSGRVVSCTRLLQRPSFCVYSDDSSLPDSSIAALTQALERLSDIRPQNTPGPINDLDHNGCLTIVVGRLSAHLTDTDVPLLGCVRADDFLQPGPFAGDIIYLDDRLLTAPALPAVLIHERSHAALFSRLRDLQSRSVSPPSLPAWLNEAVAHSCEFQMYPESPNLVHRIQGYLREPERWPLIPPEPTAAALSTRGPLRAAGLFFVESMREHIPLNELVDSVLLSGHGTPQGDPATFQQAFHNWTIWMSEQQIAGRLDLSVRPVPEPRKSESFVLRGTAATYWETEEPVTVTVSTSERCRLQLTITRDAASNELITAAN